MKIFVSVPSFTSSNLLQILIKAILSAVSLVCAAPAPQEQKYSFNLYKVWTSGSETFHLNI